MRMIDADTLFKDICDSINEMTKIGIMVDGEWLWAKLNDALENAPTIEPKKGKWIRDAVWFTRYHCSQCGEKTEDTIMNRPRYNFCPNCGVKMKSE